MSNCNKCGARPLLPDEPGYDKDAAPPEKCPSEAGAGASSLTGLDGMMLLLLLLMLAGKVGH